MVNHSKLTHPEKSANESERAYLKQLLNDLKVLPKSPGRLIGSGPISVIDIGSNSVRLVTYECLSRSPIPIFNEKALCGLGRGLSETGLLDEEAVENAIAAIHRFKAISDQLKSAELYVLATAAAREASNGTEFIERVAEISDVDPLVLSGEDEAHYSCCGVLSGFYQADGLIGDMGGGSLELADIHDEAPGDGMTLPLGGLRLQDMSDRNLKKAISIARSHLDDNDILKKGAGRPFYAIGGTWRSLASLHMHQNNYPLHVLHNYSVPSEAMADFCLTVLKSSLDEIDYINVVSKSRAALLPYGAAVLLAIIEQMNPSHIVVSALGVREGFLYDQLSEEQRRADNLIAGAQELSLLRSRSPENARELVGWTKTLFRAANIPETAAQIRLRIAGCLLSDIGWRAHPDYRGQQSFNTIAHAAFVGIDHPGRAFISMSAYFRQERQVGDGDLPAVARLLKDDDMRFRARLLGLAFRTAHLISASMVGALSQSEFIRDDGTLVLVIDEEQAAHVGERLIRRLNQIGKLVGMETEIRLDDNS